MNKNTSEKFSATVKGDYIHLKTWGELNTDDLEAPVMHALELAKKNNITKILDDIREVDSAAVSLPVQMKGAGILWKLRAFKKVAIIFKDEEIGYLFFSMLESLHLSGNFKGFNDEAEAIKWLEEA